MKKVFYTIATWFKSMFAKKQPNNYSYEQTQSQVTIDLPINQNEETVEDMKKLLKDWAKSNNDKVQEQEHELILSHTVRSTKPDKYSKKKNIIFKTDKVEYSLTAKQDYFLNEIRFLQEKNQDANINDVVINFLNMKYMNTDMAPTENELKPAYHKKTINYLVKCGAIKSTAKNCYRTTF